METDLASVDTELTTATFVRCGADIATLRTVGGSEVIMPISEWGRRGTWRKGERVVAAVVSFGDTPALSTTAPGLVPALFAGHVPEVRDGRVRIMGIAREPGARTKVAVAAAQGGVDAVQACVGRAACRVRAIVAALGGEKVDIVAWDPDRNRLVGNAMAPAKVLEVRDGDDEGIVEAVVPRHQMAAAVGESGLNSQLAGRLAGVDVEVVAAP